MRKNNLLLYLCPVSAGFPSPADDFVENALDLNQHLIKHPAATFFVKAQGDSMLGAGIHSGDLLIVDRSIRPQDGKVVLGVIDGEFTVKTLHHARGKVFLMPENCRYPAIEVKEEMDFSVWGVITNVVHPL